MDIPEPITREDLYYSYIINGGGTLPEPVTRRDVYLHYLCVNGIGSGGTITPEMIEKAVDRYLTENPVQSGATEEQAAQIMKNADAISVILERLDEGSMTLEEMLEFLYADG